MSGKNENVYDSKTRVTGSYTTLSLPPDISQAEEDSPKKKTSSRISKLEKEVKNSTFSNTHNQVSLWLLLSLTFLIVVSSFVYLNRKLTLLEKQVDHLSSDQKDLSEESKDSKLMIQKLLER